MKIPVPKYYKTALMACCKYFIPLLLTNSALIWRYSVVNINKITLGLLGATLNWVWVGLMLSLSLWPIQLSRFGFRFKFVFILKGYSQNCPFKTWGSLNLNKLWWLVCTTGASILNLSSMMTRMTPSSKSPVRNRQRPTSMTSEDGGVLEALFIMLESWNLAHK